jgi:hypothetical protein
MYDKFDDDIEKSGLRFDGNEPSYNRKRIKKIVQRTFFITIALIVALTFIERQRYNLNERHINHINTSGEIYFTTFYSSSKIRGRAVNAESGTSIVSQINYISGGEDKAQIRFHLLNPNPFSKKDFNSLIITATHGKTAVPAPFVYMKDFWGCQMLNITFTLTEDTVTPKHGEPFEIKIHGEGITATIIFNMP